MKRLFALALVAGSFSTFGLVGCSEETKDKTVSTKETPTGTATTTTETKTKATGDEKPSAKNPE